MAYVDPRAKGRPGTFERVERLPDADVQAALARITAIAKMMDSLFAIPGTRIRVGVDAILGLVPVVGDLLSQVIATYIIWEARQLGVSKLVLWRMVANTLIDTAVGSVPLVGDAFDVAFRANMKNLRLLQRHLEKRGYRVPMPGTNVIDGEYRRVA
jgi:uncharacterized protein DUF4112